MGIDRERKSYSRSHQQLMLLQIVLNLNINTFVIWKILKLINSFLQFAYLLRYYELMLTMLDSYRYSSIFLEPSWR